MTNQKDLKKIILNGEFEQFLQNAQEQPGFNSLGVWLNVRDIVHDIHRGTLEEYGLGDKVQVGSMGRGIYLNPRPNFTDKDYENLCLANQETARRVQPYHEALCLVRGLRIQEESNRSQSTPRPRKPDRYKAIHGY